jgi:hypothetical protein
LPRAAQHCMGRGLVGCILCGCIVTLAHVAVLHVAHEGTVSVGGQGPGWRPVGAGALTPDVAPVPVAAATVSTPSAAPPPLAAAVAAGAPSLSPTTAPPLLTAASAQRARRVAAPDGPPIVSDAVCVRDAAQLPPLPPLPAPAWMPDLDAATSATSFPQLRTLLSGRPPAPLPPDLAALLAEYAVVHAEVMGGARPQRVLVMEGCGRAEGQCGGVGDRLKSLRMCFYAAVLSGRALVLQDWVPVGLGTVFGVGQVDWRLPGALEASLGSVPAVHGSWCVGTWDLGIGDRVVGWWDVVVVVLLCVWGGGGGLKRVLGGVRHPSR